jgi:hypothetical protein
VLILAGLSHRRHELKNRIVIEIHTASFRTTRGAPNEPMGWDEPEKGIRGRIFLGWLARIQYAAAMGA